MAQDDARLVDADRASEDAIATAPVALLVRPARELRGARRMAERDRTLPNDETEHDPQRFRPRAHARISSHARASGVKPARRLTFPRAGRHVRRSESGRYGARRGCLSRAACRTKLREL